MCIRDRDRVYRKVDDKTMRIEKLAEIREKKSPLCIQDPWDNSGFQIKFEAAPVNRAVSYTHLQSSSYILPP